MVANIKSWETNGISCSVLPCSPSILLLLEAGRMCCDPAGACKLGSVWELVEALLHVYIFKTWHSTGRCSVSAVLVWCASGSFVDWIDVGTFVGVLDCLTGDWWESCKSTEVMAGDFQVSLWSPHWIQVLGMRSYECGTIADTPPLLFPGPHWHVFTGKHFQRSTKGFTESARHASRIVDRAEWKSVLSVCWFMFMLAQLALNGVNLHIPKGGATVVSVSLSVYINEASLSQTGAGMKQT